MIKTVDNNPNITNAEKILGIIIVGTRYSIYPMRKKFKYMVPSSFWTGKTVPKLGS